MAEGVIEIIIGGAAETEGSGGGSVSKEKSSEDIFSDKIQKLAHPINTAKGAARKGLEAVLGKAGTAGALYFAGHAASTAYRIAKMELNRSFSLKENYLAQNKITAFESEMGAIKGIASTMGSSIAMGAMAGSSLGPVGTVIGAVFGTVYGVASSAINVQIQKEEAMERHNMQLNSTNAQTTFSASRAALVNGGRGTEY